MSKAEPRDDHDQLFKSLLRGFLGEFVSLVAPEFASQLRLSAPEFLDQETFTDLPRGQHRRLDLVAKVETRAGQPEIVLVHVEVEGEASAEMARRMYRYYMQLQLRHELPVFPVVLYLSGGPPDLCWNERQEKFLHREISRFCFLSLGLSGAEAEAYLARPEPLAAALAALMRPSRLSPARLKLECQKKIIRAPINEARQLLLFNCVETYLSLSGEALHEYDRLRSQEPAKEVAVMQTWADRMREEGHAQGVQHGLQRGLQQGVLEGKRAALREILSARGLALSTAQDALLQACEDSARLDAWLRLALSVARSEDIFSPSTPRPKRSKKG